MTLHEFDVPITVKGTCAGCDAPIPAGVELLPWREARQRLLAAGWGINDEDGSGLCPTCMKPADLLDDEETESC